MERAVLSGFPGSFRKLYATNPTSTAFAAIVQSTTDPAGDGVFTLGRPGAGSVPDSVAILFFGVGADNTTFDARVIGYRYLPPSSDTEVGSWVAELLCQVSCTLSAGLPGLASTPVNASQLYCDTVSVTNGIGIVGDVVTDVLPARLVVPAEGCSRIKVVFDMTGATSGNALVAEE